jgi:DNA-binding SARP family transcriptional activator
MGPTVGGAGNRPSTAGKRRANCDDARRDRCYKQHMAVEFCVLGPLEALRDGQPVRLGGRRERALLAILLVHANETLSTDRIFDELYGESPPATAGSSIQNAVSRLRKALGPDAIETRMPGYVIHAGTETFDALRFRELVAEAPAEPRPRLAVLREALELWRGDPYGDFAFEPFAQTEIARLEELRLVALEERIEAELALGRYSLLVGELTALIAEHPFRERLRRQLMAALYGAGRQADALEAYREARSTLIEELGIEPSPELRELEGAILRQDAHLVIPRRAAPASPVPQLPEPLEHRQTVTVLFADIVDSTRLARSLDPEALRGVVARYFTVLRGIFEQYGGTVEKFIGDAVLAVFGVPRVHEDDALRAVRAAWSAREALAELNVELASDWGVEIAVRMGINTGEVVAGGSHQLLASGHAVNLAKRLEEIASANEILVGEATWRLVGEAVQARPVELAAAGDVDSAWRVEGISEAPAFARRLETPLVGRQRELARLRDAYQRAVDNDRAQLLTVLGSAGIGKTRLALELAAMLGDVARLHRSLSVVR